MNLITKQIYGNKKTNQVNAWSGLVSLYKLDETSGIIAYDSFGSDNLTNSGITINQSGKLGTSYLSTAGTQNLSASGLTAITGNCSINVWCYRTANCTGADNVIAENGDYGNGFGVWMNLSGGVGPMYNYNYGNYTAENLPLNTWVMVTCTYNGSLLKTYIDGVLKSTLFQSGTITATTRRMFNRIYGGSGFIGRIDNCSFFNIAITQEQITAHYNSGNGITL